MASRHQGLLFWRGTDYFVSYGPKALEQTPWNPIQHKLQLCWSSQLHWKPLTHTTLAQPLFTPITSLLILDSILPFLPGLLTAFTLASRNQSLKVLPCHLRLSITILVLLTIIHLRRRSGSMLWSSLHTWIYQRLQNVRRGLWVVNQLYTFEAAAFAEQVPFSSLVWRFTWGYFWWLWWKLWGAPFT